MSAKTIPETIKRIILQDPQQTEYVLIENAIQQRLDLLEGTKAIVYPDNPDELGSPTQASQILVGYSRSTFKDLSELPITQEESPIFEITLKMRGLRTHSRAHQGALPVIAKIKRLLRGYLPVYGQGVKPLRPVNSGFKAVKNGIWYYFVNVRMSFVESEYAPFLEGATQQPRQPTEFKVIGGLWRASPGAFGIDPNEDLANVSTLDQTFTSTGEEQV